MEVKIELYDKRERVTSTIYVEQINGNTFEMIDNHIFNCTLTKGTQFQTRINGDGRHEIIKISKKSEFITKRFWLPVTYRPDELRMLGDELVSQGGFWQFDFGGHLIVNIPKDFKFDVDAIINEFNLQIIEVT